MDYTTEFMLDRAFVQLENNRAQKFMALQPKIQSKDRKTVMLNFADFCKSINKTTSQEMDHVKEFIKDGLRVEMSIRPNGTLFFDKTCKNKDIEGVLVNYIKSYILCPERCGSGNTKMLKENRITFLVCNVCKAKKSLNGIGD